jgi:hypothetical protein
VYLLHLASVVLLLVAIAPPAQAVSIVINNGLAPPNPENVIDDGTYASDRVYVENVGFNTSVEAPCVSPGAPTWGALVQGGVIGNQFVAANSSVIEMSGGAVGGGLNALATSTVIMQVNILFQSREQRFSLRQVCWVSQRLDAGEGTGLVEISTMNLINAADSICIPLGE